MHLIMIGIAQISNLMHSPFKKEILGICTIFCCFGINYLESDAHENVYYIKTELQNHSFVQLV